MMPVLIFGAGRTGRGFCAHICQRGGMAFELVDNDGELVQQLQAVTGYPVEILGAQAQRFELVPHQVHALQSASWYPTLVQGSLCFTAVFGPNLVGLGHALAAALIHRFKQNPTLPLNIITCENATRAAVLLRDAVLTGLVAEPVVAQWCRDHVGFVEAMVLKTCLGPDHNAGEPLLVRAQALFNLPCDAAGFNGDLPPLADVQALPHFDQQLRRKIFTYNCINAVITYLGALKGYERLDQAANDAQIAVVAAQAGVEAGQGLVAEFGFDLVEQQAWTTAALDKFSDRQIPDPLGRNGADPVRKLGPDDRLVGPALLALKHGIIPTAIIQGIIAAFYFSDVKQPSIFNAQQQSMSRCLTQICQLKPEDALFKHIIRYWQKMDDNE